jgi:site-specific recombinase XerD
MRDDNNQHQNLIYKPVSKDSIIDLSQYHFLNNPREVQSIAINSTASFLEQFTARATFAQTILDKFDTYLIASGRSENTRKSYNTDISQALIIKLFHYFDFKSEHKSLAHVVATMHVLIGLDNAVKEQRTATDSARKIFSSVVELSVEQIPGFLSSNSSRNELNGRIQMSLRGRPERGSANVLNKADRLALQYIFSICEEDSSPSFWKQVFSVPAISQVLAHLRQENCSENTIARKISSYRVFEKFLMQSEILDRRIMDSMDSPRIQPKAQISISHKEIEIIKKYLEATLKSELRVGSQKEQLLAYRNRAIFAVCHYTGIRASALCGLSIHDFNRESKNLVVLEKGRKNSIKPIDDWALQWLEDFIDKRNSFLTEFKVEPQSSSALFHSRLGRPLQSRTLWRIISETAERAGISVQVGERTNFGPHADRRSRARELKEKGANIEQVSEFLGHRHLSTTQIYTRDFTHDQRALLKKLERNDTL